jgi:N-methylhydantoinase A
VTDANLVLGYLNPEYFAGGSLRLDAEAARQAVAARVARPLGLAVEDAAWGIHAIVNTNMELATRVVSIERGRDPRDFTLVAFGGSGPVHATGLAEALDITRILIPPHPGLFSAIGLLSADVEQLHTRSFLRELGKADLAAAETIFREMEARVLGDLATEGFGADSVRLERFADLRYRKQISELLLPLPAHPLGSADRGPLAEAFHTEHETTYGYAMRDERIEIVALKVKARAARATAAPDWTRMHGGRGPGGERNAYFGRDRGTRAVQVLGRGDLGERALAGPLVIEEYDSTTVVPPAWRARLGAQGFIYLERAA